MALVTFGFACAAVTGWVANDVWRIWRTAHPPKIHTPRHAKES